MLGRRRFQRMLLGLTLVFGLATRESAVPAPRLAAAPRRLAGACYVTIANPPAKAATTWPKNDTDSSALNATQCAAWQAGFDNLSGNTRASSWTACSNARNDPCGCSRVVCRGGSIVVISLTSSNLVGPLPTEWSAFTDIQIMYLGDNKLTGPLPLEWAGLAKLEVLQVYNNKLGGGLPPEYAALTAIKKLDLNTCELTGPLPVEWAALVAIESLKLKKNLLSGGLPKEYAALTNLVTLDVGHNTLGGELPAEWAALRRMEYLTLTNNDLIGPLPTIWANMTAMVSLYLDQNKLTGPLPVSWAAMKDIMTLYVQKNKLTGGLPKDYRAFTKMLYLDLSHNDFTGNLPAEYGELTLLQYLHLEENMFGGEIPIEWEGLTTKLTRLSLNGNRLHGIVPEFLGRWVAQGQITSCCAYQNHFRCPLPLGFEKCLGFGPKCNVGRPPTCCNTNTFDNYLRQDRRVTTTTCLACPGTPNATGLDIGADCFVCTCGSEPCAVGKYGLFAPPQSGGANHTCTVCPRGTFQDVVGSEGINSCKSCGAATSNIRDDSDPGSASIDNCVAVLLGRFCDTGKSAGGTFGDCVNCTAGRFKDGNNTKACQSCPCGEWQDLPGQGACGTTCVAGTFGSGTTGQCEPCPSVGFFCLEAQKIPFSKATRCIPGEHELFAPNVTSDRVCAPCTPGAFSNTSNLALCFACGADEFQVSAGQGFCSKHTVCAAGEHQVISPTATSDRVCSKCAQGTFSNATNLASCFVCGADEFQPSAGQGTCTRHTVCAVGGFQTVVPTANSDRTCGICAAGTFANATNLAACFACGADKFQPSEGQGFCTQHGVCAAGERQTRPEPTTTSDRTCGICAAGTFSNATNLAACFACGTDEFQPRAGQTLCIAHTLCGKGERVVAPSPSTIANRLCAKCPPQHFSSSNNAARCERCPAGKFQNAAGQPFCEAKQPCAPGTFEANATDTSLARCKPCRAGFWCQTGASTRCGSANLFCPPNSSTPTAVAIGHYSTPEDAEQKYHRTGQTACEPGSRCKEGIRTPCPANRVCQLSSTTQRNDGAVVNVTTEQRCDDAEFVFEGKCHTCPALGAKCTDGEVELKPGFWYDPQHGALAEFWGKRSYGASEYAETGIYQCAPGSCMPDATSGLPVCTVGRRGPLCAVCTTGYYGTEGLGCKPCPLGAHVGRMIGTVVLVIVLGICLWLAKRKLQAKHPKRYASIAEKLPEVLKLLTGLFQILGAFATVLYRVPWPSAFRTITSFAGVLTLDVFALPSIRCSSLGSTYYGRFDLHMITTLVITGLFAALLFYAYSRHNQSRAKPLSTSLVWNTFLPFLFIIYPSISKTTILMLRCRAVDGASYLLADLALSCETAEYASYRRFAIFGVLVFPVGIVVFFTALVGHNRRKLPPDWWPARAPEEAQAAYQKYRAKRLGAKPFGAWRAEAWDPRMAKYDKMHKRIGFLFSAYNKGSWWFESLILIYKLAMTVLVVFVSDGDENKILFGMLGATMMMAVLAFFQPFRHASILSINTGGQMVVLLVLFAAMFLLLNGGSGSSVPVTVVLVVAPFAPLVAGVVLTLRLPEEARVCEAGDTLTQGMSKAVQGLFKSPPGKESAAAAAAPPERTVRSASGFSFSSDNPMHAKPAEPAGRESALVVGERPPAAGEDEAAAERKPQPLPKKGPANAGAGVRKSTTRQGSFKATL